MVDFDWFVSHGREDKGNEEPSIRVEAYEARKFDKSKADTKRECEFARERANVYTLAPSQAGWLPLSIRSTFVNFQAS